MKDLSFNRNLIGRIFCRITCIFLNKGKSTVPPLFDYSWVFSSASDKVMVFTGMFSKTSNLGYPGIFLLAFSARSNLKLHNII